MVIIEFWKTKTFKSWYTWYTLRESFWETCQRRNVDPKDALYIQTRKGFHGTEGGLLFQVFFMFHVEQLQGHYSRKGCTNVTIEIYTCMSNAIWRGWGRHCHTKHGIASAYEGMCVVWMRSMSRLLDLHVFLHNFAHKLWQFLNPLWVLFAWSTWT